MDSSGLFFSYDHVRLKLEAWCAYQDRCEFDVRKKIANFSLSVEETERLVQHLQAYQFLDNERYLESYISGKVKIKRWGRNKIKAELMHKRLPHRMIQKTLMEIDEELYLANLQALAEKKLTLLEKEKDAWKKKQKCFQFLASKGYELDLIQDVYRMLVND